MKDLLDVLKPGSKDWALANTVDPNRLPAHIAIIMDGNGRWARRRSLPRAAGHKAGIEAVRTAVEACSRLGIQALTLYAFSVENWQRPSGVGGRHQFDPRRCAHRRTPGPAQDRRAGHRLAPLHRRPARPGPADS